MTAPAQAALALPPALGLNNPSKTFRAQSCHKDTHRWLQDGGSSHHPMPWVPGGFARLLSGITAGALKEPAEPGRTLCPAPAAQEGVGRAHSAQHTLGSHGLEENDLQYLALILNCPSEFMEKHSCFNKSSISQFHSYSACISAAFYASCTKNPPTKVNWKQCLSTRPCRNTTASYFCSYPWRLPKFPSWDHQTQDTQAKAPKGSFHYLGEIYCLSASRNLLLPPAFGLLPTSLICNSLKEYILTCNTIPCSPHKKSDAKKLTFLGLTLSCKSYWPIPL